MTRGCGIDGEFCQSERLERMETVFDAIYQAFAAMMCEMPDGSVCFKTLHGVPMQMPKRTERLASNDAVRAFIMPLETENGGECQC